MEISPIPLGNQALPAAISGANTPHLQEQPSPSPSTQPSPPLTFLAESFADTRNRLQLNPYLVQDLSTHALQTITTGEVSIVSIPCATIAGIVAITTQLDTVTAQLSEIPKQNQDLGSNLHDLSPKIATESATDEDIHPLQFTLGDLPHCVTTTAPTTRPMAATAPLNASLQEVS